jgi:hypothetical protein
MDKVKAAITKADVKVKAGAAVVLVPLAKCRAGEVIFLQAALFS